MIQTVKLYGALRKLSGVSEFQADVSNVDQIFSFIKVNYPQTKEHLAEAFYSIYADDLDITFKNLVINQEENLKVIPIISGNFWSIFFTTLISGFVNTAITGTAALLSALAMGGLSLLAEALAPVPLEPATDPQVTSFLSNQTTNTTKAGGAAPLIFGECLVGSVVISAASDTVQITDNSP